VDIKSGRVNLDSGVADLDSGLVELESGLVDLESGLVDLESDLVDSESDLVDSEGKLRDLWMRGDGDAASLDPADEARKQTEQARVRAGDGEDDGGDLPTVSLTDSRGTDRERIGARVQLGGGVAWASGGGEIRRVDRDEAAGIQAAGGCAATVNEWRRNRRFRQSEIRICNSGVPSMLPTPFPAQTDPSLL
jgi:hypothetical protein